MLDEEPDIVDAADATPLELSTGHVHFDHVRFGYGDLPDVLHDFDLDVPAGTTVALVGHTGAGKSTIANLLFRFYDPSDGRITIDGVDLRDLTQPSLRGQFGIVPQEPFLFTGTIAENIAFGRPEESRAGDRERRAPSARMDSSASCPADTTPRSGSAASGSRRAAPARGVRAGALADPRILILDEATSSIDIGPSASSWPGRCCGPDGVHHRPPALDDPRGGPNSRARPRPDRGARQSRQLMARPGPYTRLYGDWAAEVA